MKRVRAFDNICYYNHAGIRKIHPQPHNVAESFCCNTIPEETIAGNITLVYEKTAVIQP
jgi:hypothetical protein